jgi:methionine sulfoxide reductase heme-binding subunit
MTTHVFWYLARSSGFLAYLFAWGSVVLGLLMTTRVAERIERATQYILHRLLGLGSMVFLGVHLVTLFLDPWAKFSVADLLIPFHATYRPFWTGCGILTAYLLVPIAVTSIFQQRLPRAAWRGIHYLSFLTFFVGLAHGIGAGSDSGRLWARGLYALSALIVAALCMHRVLWEPTPAKRTGKSTAPRRIDPRAHALGGMSAGAAAGQQAVRTSPIGRNGGRV